jgi:hypothetical protein
MISRQTKNIFKNFKSKFNGKNIFLFVNKFNSISNSHTKFDAYNDEKRDGSIPMRPNLRINEISLPHHFKND